MFQTAFLPDGSRADGFTCASPKWRRTNVSIPYHIRVKVHNAWDKDLVCLRQIRIGSFHLPSRGWCGWWGQRGGGEGVLYAVIVHCDLKERYTDTRSPRSHEAIQAQYQTEYSYSISWKRAIQYNIRINNSTTENRKICQRSHSDGDNTGNSGWIRSTHMTNVMRCRAF